MSTFDATEWAFSRSPAKPLYKLILITLAARVGSQPVVRISRKELTKACCTSALKLDAALIQLEVMTYIQVDWIDRFTANVTLLIG